MVSEELKSKLQQITQQEIYKVIVSKPSDKAAKYRKIEIEKKSSGYQAAAYTQKQVFHEKIEPDGLLDYLSGRVGSEFLQLNAWDGNSEYMLLISKKGKVTYRCKKQAEGAAKVQESHNRKKKYLLEEGTVIPPLVDMGVFTVDGKVVRTMYDKFRQINRFLEFIEDILPQLDKGRELTILDFGCGKSYLTFAMYYYLKELKGFDIHVIGLDLKEDVIRRCSGLAKKYGYEKLHFLVGDIADYEGVNEVDVVVTLHACDTATDYALAKAIGWNAKVILSVPCCQHEVNGQFAKADKTQCYDGCLDPIMDYGLLRERFAALVTDGLRAKYLEAAGYDTQVLEFIDMEHTPKNILLRAVRADEKRVTKKSAGTAIEKCERFLQIEPTLGRLLADKGENYKE